MILTINDIFALIELVKKHWYNKYIPHQCGKMEQDLENF